MMDIHSCRVCLDAASTLISLYEVENDELIVDLLTFCVNIPVCILFTFIIN